VTDRAAAELKRMLVASHAPREQGVKLFPAAAGGVGMAIAAPKEGDLVLEGGQKPLLIVDSAIVDSVDDAVLDLGRGKETESPQFVIHREDVAGPT
jgi:hypothetical protein